MRIESIRKSHSCTIFAFFLKLIIIILMIGVLKSQHYSYKQMQILNDLPVRSDMEKYSISLEKAVNFMEINKQYVDLNVYFGVFLANVQLKNVLETKVSGLSVKMEDRLELLVKITDSILYNFTSNLIHVANYQNNQEQYSNMIHLFVGNNISWHILPRYNFELLKKTQFYSRKDIEKLYCQWSKYKKLVYSADSRKDADNSDYCLALLAQNPPNRYDRLTQCLVPYKCARLVLNGTNYGYGMTHRVLFLLMARFGRGCSLLSAAEDKKVLDRLCARLYTEAEFIANHDFQTSDLIIEIIALCSLDGNAQFLRRTWIDELLEFQTNIGCFNISRPERHLHILEVTNHVKYSRKLFLEDQMILGGSCNSHTTSVAMAMLGSAIRYVIDNYY